MVGSAVSTPTLMILPSFMLALLISHYFFLLTHVFIAPRHTRKSRIVTKTGPLSIPFYNSKRVCAPGYYVSTKISILERRYWIGRLGGFCACAWNMRHSMP